MADVFISYKREDRRIAERISITLEQLGFDVWWDFELLSGDPFRRVIEKVIDQCSATLVLWSVLARDSTFVVDEATYAKEQGKLCPARIDDCRLPLGFGGDHVIDMTGWDGEMQHEGLQSIVRTLEAKTGKKARLGARARDDNDEARHAEMEAFKMAQAAQNASALRSFLLDYPNGAFANFVRGQLEGMGVSAPAMAAARSAAPAPPPIERRPPPASYGGAPPSRAPDPPPQHQEERKSPWPMLAGAAIVVALIAVVVSLRPWESDTPPAQEAEIAAPARDVDAEIEAARQEERERATAREAELRRQGMAAEAARDQAAREQAARDQAARDQAAREQRERDEAAARAAANLPYNIDSLNPSVRSAAIEARAAQNRANAAASRARAGASGYSSNTASNGQIYEGEAGDAGVQVDGAWSTPEGHSYQGEFAGGTPAARNGYGVFRWPDGRRYEGQWANDVVNGYGVMWDPQGRISEQGIWTDANISTPLSR